MTDLPPTYPQFIPSPGTVNVVTVAGANMQAGTYACFFTLTNSWGETAAAGEFTGLVITGPNQAIQINYYGPPGAKTIRCYLTLPNGPPGTEQQMVEFPAIIAPFVGIANITTTPTIAAQPPVRNTAYLPDSDGQAVSAFAIYRWLNQALGWAAAKNRGGLPDFGAAGTTNGQPNYVMPGYWKKIDSAWFDGYPLGLLAKNNVFRRNPVPGYSGMLIVFQATDRLMVEAWPQPNRTSNVSTLAAPIGATDTTATLVSTAGYVLGFGMTQIGPEIVNYAAIQGNQLLGLTRGMCGTVPTAQQAGAVTTELNLMISGFRVPSTYTVGQSQSTLYLPPGWDEALISYMLYRFRSAEQDDAAAKRYLQEATQKLSDLSANRIIAGPRQISPYSSIGPEVGAGLGTAFGGVIIP
jgi:hypothetical protein